MSVKIITYSQTGNTLSVSKLIYDRLIELNINVLLEEIKVTDNKIPRSNPFTIKSAPRTDADIIILATLVEGFLPSPVMVEYINNQDFTNKKVICLVTHFFPFAWMGGNQAISKMTSLLTSKNANVVKTGIVNWTNKKRQINIDEVVSSIVDVIKKENK